MMRKDLFITTETLLLVASMCCCSVLNSQYTKYIENGIRVIKSSKKVGVGYIDCIILNTSEINENYWHQNVVIDVTKSSLDCTKFMLGRRACIDKNVDFDNEFYKTTKMIEIVALRWVHTGIMPQNIEVNITLTAPVCLDTHLYFSYWCIGCDWEKVVHPKTTIKIYLWDGFDDSCQTLEDDITSGICTLITTYTDVWNGEYLQVNNFTGYFSDVPLNEIVIS